MKELKGDFDIWVFEMAVKYDKSTSEILDLLDNIFKPMIS